MGWNKTDHEGKVCYERDGMRVFRTQDIDAIERQDKLQAEQRNSVRWDYPNDECDNTESDLTTTQVIIILAMAFGAILYLIFGVR